MSGRTFAGPRQTDLDRDSLPFVRNASYPHTEVRLPEPRGPAARLGVNTMWMLLAVGVVLLGTPARAADPPPKADRHGDPLPQGAMMRLGTLRNRAPITGFGIEKDGTVVTVGPGVGVRRWHAVDDRAEPVAALPLPGPATSNNYPQVSPDGRLVAACSNE